MADPNRGRAASAAALYMLFIIGVWLHHGFGVFWHGPARYYMPLTVAIEKAIFLGEDKDTQPLRWARKFQEHKCDLSSDLLYGNSSLYGACPMFIRAKAGHCGFAVFYNPRCRTLAVRQRAWKNEKLRKHIVRAALTACKYLINVDERDLKAFRDDLRYSFERYGYDAKTVQMHQLYWRHAGCDQGGPKIIYFEVYDVEGVYPDSVQVMSQLYKAYREDGVIGGRYVRL